MQKDFSLDFYRNGSRLSYLRPLWRVHYSVLTQTITSSLNIKLLSKDKKEFKQQLKFLWYHIRMLFPQREEQVFWCTNRKEYFLRNIFQTIQCVLFPFHITQKGFKKRSVQTVDSIYYITWRIIWLFWQRSYKVFLYRETC